MTTINILTTGAGGTTGQSIIKALRIAKLNCRIIAVDMNPMSAGLYRADAGYLTPRADSPKYIPRLIEICNTEQVGAILVGSTPEVPVLAENKARIESETGALVIVSDAETVDICHSKYRTCEFFQKHNIDSPKTANITCRDDAVDFIKKNSLPVILKPHHGCAAKGVHVINSLDEFDTYYNPKGLPVILQEYLGCDAQEYTCGLFYDKNRRFQGSVVMKRELAYGGTYRGLLDDFPEIDAYIRTIGDSLRPVGPINIQLRMAERGPVAFEINPRFSCSDAMRAQMGYNATEATIRNFILGQDDVQNCLEWQKGISMRYMNEVVISIDQYEQMKKQGKVISPVSELFTGF